MLGMLVREHGDDLSTDELIGIADLLLIAGHETTSNMLGLGTLALLRHPDQLALVRDDPAAVGPAVEELLRWLSSCTPASRGPRPRVEFGGVASRASWWSGAARGQPRPGFLDRRATGWTSPAALSATSPSATACTTAWAPRWPGWRCGSRSRRCCVGSRARPAVPFEEVGFRSFHVVYGLRSCR